LNVITTDTAMRIVTYINSYTEGIAGGDKWIIEIIRRLSKKGCSFILVTSALGKRTFSSFLSNYDMNIKYILTSDEKKFSHNIFNILLTYLRRTIKATKLDINSDIYFASSNFLPDVIPVYLKKKGKKVAIVHMIPPNPLYGYKGHFRRQTAIKDSFRSFLYYLNHIISLYFLKRFDCILAISTTVDELISSGVPADKIYVTYNGVDFDFINSISIKEKEYEGCWVGRVHPQKGFEDLLYIWKIVVEKIPNAKLVIMGKGTEKYYKVIEKMELGNNIIIEGFVSERRKIEILKKCKIFLFPSYYESFGIVLLEALASDTIVVAYDLPVLRKIYGDNLIYVPLGDKKAFASIVIKLLKSGTTNLSRREELEQVLKKFSWDNIAEEVYKVLKTCLEKP